MAPPLDLSGDSSWNLSIASVASTELRLGLPGSESPERGDAGAVLTLGLPKSFASAGAKRGFSDVVDAPASWGFGAGRTGSEVELGKGGSFFAGKGESGGAAKEGGGGGGSAKAAPAAKARVVGWPPIRSFRKNTMASYPSKDKESTEGKEGLESLYVKVSMEGAPYLRKIDLKTYSNYKELSAALENMFTCFTIGQCGTQGTHGKEEVCESRVVDLLQGSEYVLTYEDKDGDWMLVGDVPWDMFINSCKRMRIMKGSDAIGIAPRSMEKSRKGT